MALASFLFNDSLNLDNYQITSRTGTDAPQDASEVLDGYIHTCPTPSTQLDFVARRPNAPPFDSIGLINQNALTREMAYRFFVQGGADGDLSSGNVNFGSGNFVLDAGAAKTRTGVSFQMRAQTAALCPALVFFGVREDVELILPPGWKVPLVHPVEDVVKLSDNNIPVGRFAIARPIKITIPFLYRDDPHTLTSIIERVERQPFLFRWKPTAPWMYCWGKRDDDWKLTTPTLSNMTLNISGFIRYENIGGAAPGSLANIPGVGVDPTGGVVVGRRLATGYSYKVENYPGGGSYGQWLDPLGNSYHLYRNTGTFINRVDARPAPLLSVLDPNEQVRGNPTPQGALPPPAFGTGVFRRPRGMIIGQ